MMGLRIPIHLLRAWRSVLNKRKSNSPRMGPLDHAAMVDLSTRVWIQEDGDVWSDLSGKMARIKPQQSGKYKIVLITLAGKQRSFRVGRLVMFAWHHKRLTQRCAEAAAAGDTEHLHPDDYECGHLNDDPSDNRAVNIEPQTSSEQMRQSFARPDRRSNAGALSNPVVVAEIRADASDRARAFPVGHQFESAMEAERQTGINNGGISRSTEKNWFAGGIRFEAGVRDGDHSGPSWRVWYPSIETGKWCMTLGGRGIRVSNDGWIWFKDGDRPTRGWVRTGTIYRTIRTGGKTRPVHSAILRVASGAFDEDGEWIAQAVPKDANGKDLMCLHGGPGRASDDERRADGTERNHLVDLRWGTATENAADLAHSRATKRARSA